MQRLLVLLLLFALCTPAALPGQDAAAKHRAAFEKDAAELSTYALTMDIVTRLFQATHAATEAAKADPSIKVSFEGDDHANSPTIDQLAGKLATSPKLVSLLAGYSFTPRQFSSASLSLIQTGLAMVALQSGKKLDEVGRLIPVNPANIKFLQEHSTEISALQTKYPTQ